MEENLEDKKPHLQWLKRLGIAGFLFFLFKGIGWLLFLYFGATMFKGCGF